MTPEEYFALSSTTLQLEAFIVQLRQLLDDYKPDMPPDDVPDDEPDDEPDDTPDDPPAPVPTQIIGCGIARDATTGRTIFAQGGETIYVAYDGSDSDDGSKAKPVATLTQAEQLANQRNSLNIEVLTGPVPYLSAWSHFGTSPAAPILISARSGHPMVSGLKTVQKNQSAAMALVGLTLDRPAFHAQGGWLTIEDCLIPRGSDIQSTRDPATGKMTLDSSGWWEEIAIRLCTVRDAYQIHGYAQGMFAYGFDTMLVEGNIFDHNGWGPGDRFTASPIDFGYRSRAHNLYLQCPYGNAIIRHNIIARGCSHGIHMRNGGICEENLFYRNPINLQFGYFEGNRVDDPYYPASDGEILRNVFLGSDAILPPLYPRGVGIYLANLNAVDIGYNIFAGFHKNDFGYNQFGNEGVIYFQTDDKKPLGNVSLVDNKILDWEGTVKRLRGDGPKPGILVEDWIHGTNPFQPGELETEVDSFIAGYQDGVPSLAAIRSFIDSAYMRLDR